MKMFSKVRYDNGHRSIYFFGMHLFSYDHKRCKKNEKTSMSPDEIFKYLSKYKTYLDEKPNKKVTGKYSNCIWQLWLQGYDNAPELIKTCLESVKKWAGNRQVIVLDANSIEKYIDIPTYIKQKYLSGDIGPAHFSDYIRIALLAKYGGTWVDSTVFMTGQIDESILKSKFFVFKNRPWMNFESMIPSAEFLSSLTPPIFEGVNALHFCSNWFIHANNNSAIINNMLRLLEAYWANENTAIDYYFFHYFITICILFDNECQKEFSKMPSLSNIFPHVLQNVLRTKNSLDLFHEIKKYSFCHKLDKHIDLKDLQKEISK